MEKKIYLITDEAVDFDMLYEKTEQVLEEGISFLQYRAKFLDDDTVYRQSEKLLKLCRNYDTSFIINDRLSLCMELNADGVHLGEDDTTIEEARRIMGDEKIIGATAKTISQALTAQNSGADYLGCGALFPSLTKPHALPIALEELRKIHSSVCIPVFCIGGINSETLTTEIAKIVDGAALISAIYGSDDIKNEIRKIKEILSLPI